MISKKHLFTSAVIIGVCLLSVVLGHFFSPIGMYASMITTVLSTVLVLHNYKRFNPLYNVVMIYIAIAINDIGIKLYGGGMHDSEGQGFLTVLFIAQSIIVLVLLFMALLKSSGLSTVIRLFAFLLLALLLVVHMEIFGNLGIGRY